MIVRAGDGHEARHRRAGADRGADRAPVGGLNDPAFLTRCIPGCRSMQEIAPDSYTVHLDLKVASVGGSLAIRNVAAGKGAADRGDLEIEAHRVAVRGDLLHGTAAGDAARQECRIVEALPTGARSALRSAHARRYRTSRPSPARDDHGSPLALAIASPMAEMRIGSASKRMPSGRTASLMALEMAAGAPR